MTKKAKQSKKEKSFEPKIFLLPYLGIAYGLFADRESFDKVLDSEGIPSYAFNTEIHYAATYRGEYKGKRYAFVYVEDLLNDKDLPINEKLSIIAHEAYHVVCHMTELMGEDSPSEEFVAYALSDVCSNLFEQFFEWRDLNGG